MADVLTSSPSLSSASFDATFSDSPTNYTVMGRADYEEQGIKRAFIDLLKLTIPITITSLFVSFLLALNLIWIGHHANEAQFAGAALGNMMVNVMGNSIIIGMTSGLDTQCGQAYGAKLYKMMGVLVQRSVLISHIVIVCVASLFWFADDLLKLMGQNEDASNEAALFIRIFIASLWPIAMFGNLRRYLQAQRKVRCIPVAVLVGLIVQVIALVVLVNVLHWGYIGACIALPCSYWSMTATLYGFIWLHKPLRRAVSATWPGWGSWAFKDWNRFLKLSVWGTFQLCSEWWALEVMAIFAGHFGTQYVAAFTVTLNAIAVFARVPLAISFSAAVLVGHKLGAQKPISAKIIYDCSTALGICVGVVFGAVLFVCAEPLSHVYTEVASIRPIVADALPYTAIYFVFYAYQRASAGGVRGMGRQNIGAIIYIIAYYLIGMPLGIWFGFDGLLGNGEPMHIKGLWVGAAISAIIGSFFFLFFRFWVNWDRECERALKRIEHDQEKLMEFRMEVKHKFGEIIDTEGGLLQADDDFEDGHESHDATANNATPSNGHASINNNSRKYGRLSGFKMHDGDNDLRGIDYDDEAVWNAQPQPQNGTVILPSTRNSSSNSMAIAYSNAPEMSHTRGFGSSLPSRSIQAGSTSIAPPPPQPVDDGNNSMLGVQGQDLDASLQSDLIGRASAYNQTNNRAQQRQNTRNGDHEKHMSPTP